jgi:hypothetical protein
VLAVSKAHRYANRTQIALGELCGERIIRRSHCECLEDVEALLKERGLTDLRPLSPPRLVADTTPASLAGGLTAADIALIERAVDDLETRLDAMEARQRAYRALLDAEAQIERELGRRRSARDERRPNEAR